MALSRSPDVGHALTADDGGTLLDLADGSIRVGLAGAGPLVPVLAELPAALQAPGSAFVTVRVTGELNGCIGSIEPEAPLAVAVAKHAWQAAFDDPRLPPLRSEQYAAVDLHVSVLSPLEEIAGNSAEEVLSELRPGVHGLLITAGPHRATFLPAVWESVAEPPEFLRLLLLKAGLPTNRWPSHVRAFRYTSQDFERPPSAGR